MIAADCAQKVPAMPSPVPPLSDADYQAIEAAVMETTRGRWFLAEYARRNRHADTEMLLGALARLENVVACNVSAGHDGVRMDAPPVDGVATEAAPEPAGDMPAIAGASWQAADQSLARAGKAAAEAACSRPDALAPLRALGYEEKIALFS
jgi:hypothetical protein